MPHSRNRVAARACPALPRAPRRAAQAGWPLPAEVSRHFPGCSPPGSSGLMGGPAPDSGGMNSGGKPGIFRVFREGLAGDISWLLAFALIGVLAWIRRPATLTLKGIKEAGLTGERGLTLISMLLWLIPGLLYFSFTTGFFHDYYIATIAPPIAGLVGIGAAGMYQKYVSGGLSGWLLPVAVLITGLVQALFLSYNADFAGLLIPIVLVGTLASTGLLAWMHSKRRTPWYATGCTLSQSPSASSLLPRWSGPARRS